MTNEDRFRESNQSRLKQEAMRERRLQEKCKSNELFNVFKPLKN